MLNADKTTSTETVDCLLVCKSYEDFNNFDNKLEDQEYFKKVRASISLFGGRDLADTVRRILQTLVAHELTLKINWIGANEKGSFQKLKNVLKLIYGKY